MAHPVQLRKKVLAARARGESASSIAQRFEIGERTVYRLQRRERDGQPVTPAKTGPRRPTKLNADDLRLLRELIEREPGVTAQAAGKRLSVRVAISTVCRAWKRMGLTLKKSR